MKGKDNHSLSLSLSLSVHFTSKEGEKGKICEHLQFIKYKRKEKKSRPGLACHVGTLLLFSFGQKFRERGPGILWL